MKRAESSNAIHSKDLQVNFPPDALHNYWCISLHQCSLFAHLRTTKRNNRWPPVFILRSKGLSGPSVDGKLESCLLLIVWPPVFQGAINGTSSIAELTVWPAFSCLGLECRFVPLGQASLPEPSRARRSNVNIRFPPKHRSIRMTPQYDILKKDGLAVVWIEASSDIEVAESRIKVWHVNVTVST